MHCHAITRRRRRRSAFTLIELLVVVAIIALLISILLPSLGHAREQGRAVVCMANIHNLGLALQMYADSHRGVLPAYGYSHGGGDELAAQAWINTMIPYIGQSWAEGGDPNSARRTGNVFRCPADRSAHWATRRVPPNGPLRRTSYASNYYLVTSGVDNPAFVEGVDPAEYGRLDNIRKPASTIYYAELAEGGEFAEADHVHPENWAWTPTSVDEELARSRHLGQEVYGFVDGRAERLPFEKTFLLRGDIAGEHEWLHNKYHPKLAR